MCHCGGISTHFGVIYNVITYLLTIVLLRVCRRLSGVVQDYIHGEVLPRIGRVAVIILSACAFGSLCYFNYTDIGFAKAVRLVYSQL